MQFTLVLKITYKIVKISLHLDPRHPGNASVEV